LERGDPRNAFWLNQARQLLTAAILQAVADAGGAGKASISELVRLCDRLPPGPFNWLRDSTLPEVEAIAGMIDLGAPETLGGMLHFVMEAVETLRSRPVQSALGPSSFPLADLIEGQPMTVYFVLPPHMLRSHARLIRFWFGALIQAMARRARSPAKPTLFVIDEAAQLGRLEAFVTLMTLMRGYGVQCASFWQDPAQMIATYPDDWQSLRNNAGLITAFGQTGRAAMRDLERFLGYPEGHLDPWAGQRLCQSGGTLMRAETRDYRHDPVLMARARPNPFHAGGSGPIERPAPKSALVRPSRPRRMRCEDVPLDPEALKLDDDLRRIFEPVVETEPEPDEMVPF
jgi:type IV secretion system protein VirD4